LDKGQQAGLHQVSVHIVAIGTFHQIDQSSENVCPLQQDFDGVIIESLILNPLSCVEDVFEVAEFEHYT
jgi:hypothetical protein